MFVIAYQNALHEFEVNAQGNLVHRASDATPTGWGSSTLDTGCTPGGLVGGDILFGQLHILAPKADGTVSYNWYTQGIGWKNQVLQ